MNDNDNRQLIADHFLSIFFENTPIAILNTSYQIPTDENFDFYQKKRSHEQIEQKDNQDNYHRQNNENDKKNINPSKKQKTNTTNSTNSSQKTDNNKKTFICHICQKICTTNSNLKKHLITHEKNKPFKCSHCTRAFNRKDYLREHEKMHINGEKPFICPYETCNKKFTTKRALTKHIKIHTNDKKFCCIYCSKTFVTNCELTIHTRIHTGETISCSKCSNTYYSYNSLRKHIKKYHT